MEWLFCDSVLQYELRSTGLAFRLDWHILVKGEGVLAGPFAKSRLFSGTIRIFAYQRDRFENEDTSI
jgi:hypothetical protein